MEFHLLKTANPLQDYSLTPGGLEQQQRDRLAMIMKLAPLAAVLGAGAGGLASLGRINQTNQPAVDMEPDPILVGQDVVKKKPGMKMAEAPLADSPATNMFNTVAKNFMPSEQHAQPHTGVYGPGLVAASTLIPGYLAYKAMRGIGQDVAESGDDADVAAAEQEFQQARALQYKHTMLNKRADHFFQAAMVKAAGGLALAELPYVNTYGEAASPMMGLPPHEAWRTLLGLGAATAGVGGVAAAMSGYNSATSKSPEQIAQMILDKRKQQLAKKPYSPSPELSVAAA